MALLETNCRRPIGRSSPTGTPLRVTTKSSPRSSARMISPLWLRNSRWVSSRVIESSVALVRQEAADQGTGQASGPIGRQRAEQGAALGDPAETPLEDPDRESAAAEIADDQGQESAIAGDIRAQHRPGQARRQPVAEQRLNQGRR